MLLAQSTHQVKQLYNKPFLESLSKMFGCNKTGVEGYLLVLGIHVAQLTF